MSINGVGGSGGVPAWRVIRAHWGIGALGLGDNGKPLLDRDGDPQVDPEPGPARDGQEYDY